MPLTKYPSDRNLFGANPYSYDDLKPNERLVLDYIRERYNAPDAECKYFDNELYIRVYRSEIAGVIDRCEATASDVIKSLHKMRFVDAGYETIREPLTRAIYVRPL